MSVLNQMFEVKERLEKQRKELSEQLLNHWLSIEDKISAVKLDVIRSDWWQDASERTSRAVPKPILRPVVAANEAAAPALQNNLLWGEWFLVSQQVISDFAEVTGDKQWIHVDEARAAVESPYKSTVAHGFLLLSLIPRLVPQRDWKQLLGQEPSMIINVGLENTRFISALKANTYVRVSIRTVALQPVKRGCRVVEEACLESQGGKTVAVAQMVYRLVFKSASAQAAGD